MPRKVSIAAITAFVLCLGLLAGCSGRTDTSQSFKKPVVLETENYPKQIGYEAQDSGSSGHAARVAFSQIGLIVWGQYYTLPAGDYIAEFRIKPGSLPAVKAPLVALSVAAGGVKNVGVTNNLALKVLTAKQLPPAYTYASIPVKFHSNGEQDLEFRIQILDPGVFLWSDYVKISKRN
jgi:hypothetical protein